MKAAKYFLLAQMLIFNDEFPWDWYQLMFCLLPMSDMTVTAL